jgi:hypothetical protein
MALLDNAGESANIPEGAGDGGRDGGRQFKNLQCILSRDILLVNQTITTYNHVHILPSIGIQSAFQITDYRRQPKSKLVFS